MLSGVSASEDQAPTAPAEPVKEDAPPAAPPAATALEPAAEPAPPPAPASRDAAEAEPVAATAPSAPSPDAVENFSVSPIILPNVNLTPQGPPDAGSISPPEAPSPEPVPSPADSPPALLATDTPPEPAPAPEPVTAATPAVDAAPAPPTDATLAPEPPLPPAPTPEPEPVAATTPAADVAPAPPTDAPAPSPAPEPPPPPAPAAPEPAAAAPAADVATAPTAPVAPAPTPGPRRLLLRTTLAGGAPVPLRFVEVEVGGATRVADRGGRIALDAAPAALAGGAVRLRDRSRLGARLGGRRVRWRETLLEVTLEGGEIARAPFTPAADAEAVDLDEPAVRAFAAARQALAFAARHALERVGPPTGAPRSAVRLDRARLVGLWEDGAARAVAREALARALGLDGTPFREVLASFLARAALGEAPHADEPSAAVRALFGAYEASGRRIRPFWDVVVWSGAAEGLDDLLLKWAWFARERPTLRASLPAVVDAVAREAGEAAAAARALLGPNGDPVAGSLTGPAARLEGPPPAPPPAGEAARFDVHTRAIPPGAVRALEVVDADGDVLGVERRPELARVAPPGGAGATPAAARPWRPAEGAVAAYVPIAGDWAVAPQPLRLRLRLAYGGAARPNVTVDVEPPFRLAPIPSPPEAPLRLYRGEPPPAEARVEAAYGAPLRFRGEATPPGVEVLEDGQLAGAPLEIGRFPLRVRLEPEAADAPASLYETQVVVVERARLRPEAEALRLFRGEDCDGVRLVALDAPEGSARLVVTGLPPGVHATADGRLEGAPEAAGRSLAHVALIAGEGALCDEAEVEVIVHDRPRLEPRSLVLFAGEPIPAGLCLRAPGAPADARFSIAGGALPVGVTLRADGQIVGTPAEAGDFRARIAVALGPRAGAAAVEDDLEGQVVPRLRLRPHRLSVAEGEPLDLALEAEGGATGRHAFEVDAATLPPGCAATPDGWIRGRPRYDDKTPAPGVDLHRRVAHAVRVTVSDAGPPAQRAEGTVQIEVAPALRVRPVDMAAWKVGRPPAGRIDIAGGVPPYRVYIASGDLPPGVSLRENGTFDGFPRRAGHYRFVVKVYHEGPPPPFQSALVTIPVEEDRSGRLPVVAET